VLIVRGISDDSLCYDFASWLFSELPKPEIVTGYFRIPNVRTPGLGRPASGQNTLPVAVRPWVIGRGWPGTPCVPRLDPQTAYLPALAPWRIELAMALIIGVAALTWFGHLGRSAGHHPVTSADHRLALTGRQALERPEDAATLLVHAGHPPTHLAIDEEDL
jgi:hypothetical protein